MTHYRLSSGADRDLHELWAYIARENVRAADRLMEALEERFVLLGEYPGAGRERPEFGQHVRSFPVGNYIVVYRPISIGVEILRIIRGSRDLDAQF